MSVLEALACGVPVVASNAGAIGEVVDASTGVLIDIGKGEAVKLAEAIHMLLEQPELRERMGREGRRRVEEFYDRKQSQRAYRELFG